MDSFRVRLNCIDHYQATPLDEYDPPVPHLVANDRPGERPQISVIRVFGATETGQKVLVHVHGALQYTYIEYTGSLATEDVATAIKTLHLSIDHALAASYRKNIYDGKHRYVAHISLVKGVPFYGFHVGYKFYLKIYLLNPLHMTRLADLLREGAIMKRALQPYESHMQYIAQWMCDYNLYGCAYLECEDVKFRAPVPKYVDLNNPFHQWHDRSILPEKISDELELPKQSNCALEIDVCVQDIGNRRNIELRPLHHDFLERLQPIQTGAKLVNSMAGLWKDETRRRKARMGLKDRNSTPFPPEVLVTMSADPRNISAAGWIHEEEYRQKVAKIAAEEYESSDRRKLNFDTFVRPVPLESNIQTALQSVEDLYPKNLNRRAAHEGSGTVIIDFQNVSGARAIVDESHVQEVVKEYRSASEEPLNSGDLIASDHIPSNQTNGQSVSSSDGQVRSPISSSEFEKFGIRKAGDIPHFDEDRFRIPEEYQTEPNMTVNKSNRSSSPKISGHSPRKKRKLLTDDQNLLPLFEEAGKKHHNLPSAGGFESHNLSSDYRYRVREGRSSENRIANQAFSKGDMTNSQNQTLSFPVVKDPNDPNTVLRLSQKSSRSEKASPRSSEQATASHTFKNAPSPVSLASVMPVLVTSLKSASSNTSEALILQDISSPHLRAETKIFQLRPPSSQGVEKTLRQFGLPDVLYQNAFYSNERDVPDQARDYAGREFKLESTTLPYLPDFDCSGTSQAIYGCKPAIIVDTAAEEIMDRQRRRRCTLSSWSIARTPPRSVDILDWLENQRKCDKKSSLKTVPNKSRNEQISQIDGPTQKNKHGFKYSQKQSSTSVHHETQYMSVMSLEVHVHTRGSLAPNPEEDKIACIFWCVQTDDEEVDDEKVKEGLHRGIVVVADTPQIALKISRSVSFEVEEESTELDALTRLVDIVRYYDPDILTGYEVHNNSWGYLIERARVMYDLNLCDELSRMKSQSHGRFGKDADRWGFNHTSTIRVTGRHTINVWRAMRGELNLLQYTMENVAYHLLHQRIPHYPFADLTKWYKSKIPRDLAKVIEYYTSRVRIDLDILKANELIPRTSEQARLLGVDWFSVISRGSQFKVESLMFRIAKPENFILVSPSRRQVGGQNALECLPLVMEPHSDFYPSPLLVLDFQSLYPSVMIAYNYCYSTFLGRVVNWRGTNKMGFSDYRREQRLIELLQDYINIAPNGIMYAKTSIRKSLLAKMLSEILETRVMVKSGMKVDKDDKTLQTLLNNRQLALKLIANVTYGYTSASFSGRMPCSEIADSIVQTARETLEKTIDLIHSVNRWGAEVVYGDTDSLFIYLKGRTREEAFDIGEDIAATVTKANPRPIKLKFEKVYHPCVLLAKKRYVGFKYEHRTQTKPDFDAKGIETVRRDGTPAEQKIEETALKVLFRTSDLSQVKGFFQAQCAKIMRGKVSIQDFCFAKEVRLGTYSDKGPPPPGALISARRMLEDPRLEPQYGERVPYVVVTGAPGARLIDRCVAPEILLNDAQSELDAEYYISKNIIPPLERIFNLVGANVRQWYDEMPKYQRIRRVEAGLTVDGKELGLPKKTLESYMKSSTCLVCRDALDFDSPICSSCFERTPQSLLYLRAKLIKAEKRTSQIANICRSCSGLAWNDEIRCDSKDCPVFYSRMRCRTALANEEAHLSPVIKMLEEKEMKKVSW